jgi:putative ABC transport system permease protein
MIVLVDRHFGPRFAGGQDRRDEYHAGERDRANARIGVRKALGARRFDIVMQFLMEAVTLTGLGGLIGIVFSVMVTFLVGWLVPSLPSEVPIGAVLVGFGVSVGVGLFFGVWPAVQAAKLDPVEALRYE